LRVLQAGVEPRRVRMLARMPPALVAAAHELRALCSPAAAEHEVLASSELARPAVRTGTPIDELSDRLARLHRGAWQLTREPHVGVTTLTDYAALSVILHAHAAGLLSTTADHQGGETRDAAAEPVIARVQDGGRAWRRLHLRLDALRTATPGSPGVRRDLLRVRQLLRDHIPLDRAGGGSVVVADRRLITTTLGAVRSMEAIGGWNARVFDDLPATRRLYLDGPHLTGDEVTNRDDLVAAKLRGGLATLTPERLLAVRDAYRLVAHRATGSEHDAGILAAPSAVTTPTVIRRSGS
jgi:hypothetical protein